VRGARVTVLATVLASAAALPNPAMNDEDQIREAIGGFVAAYNAGDADRVLSYYGEDLIKLQAGAAPETRAETARRVKDVLSHFTGRLEVHNDEIAVSGDMAFTRGRLALTLVPRAGGAAQTIERRYLEIWRKRSGRWVVVRTMDNAP
jgi:ketosteroid isomerase-like protein